jgi:hypothetical protein
MVLCAGYLTGSLRGMLCAQVLPKWRAALVDHHQELYRNVRVNGKLQRVRALPVALAMQLVMDWLPDAVEAIRGMVGELTAGLSSYDQAEGGLDQLEIADVDAGSDV